MTDTTTATPEPAQDEQTDLAAVEAALEDGPQAGLTDEAAAALEADADAEASQDLPAPDADADEPAGDEPDADAKVEPAGDAPKPPARKRSGKSRASAAADKAAKDNAQDDEPAGDAPKPDEPAGDAPKPGKPAAQARAPKPAEPQGPDSPLTKEQKWELAKLVIDAAADKLYGARPPAGLRAMPENSARAQVAQWLKYLPTGGSWNAKLGDRPK